MFSKTYCPRPLLRCLLTVFLEFDFTLALDLGLFLGFAFELLDSFFLVVLARPLSCTGVCAEPVLLVLLVSCLLAA